MAAWRGKAEKCQHLLQAGADPNHLGYKFMTALEFAKQENRTAVVELLSSLVGEPGEKLEESFHRRCDEDIFSVL